MVKPKAKVRKKQKSTAPFYVALAVIAVAGVGALAYVSTRPKQTASAAVDPNLPPLQAEGYTLGQASAPVEVVEFADFECPACSQFATITEPDVRKRLVETGQVRYRFFDFPLSMHRNTWQASMAAACANEQGKFWPMHDMLFQRQDEWNGEATGSPKSNFKGYAAAIGLDVGRWESCYDSRKYQRQIQANQAEGMKRNVGSTPTFVIGGKMTAGSIGYDELKRQVDEAAKTAPAAPAAPQTGDTAAAKTVPVPGAAKQDGAGAKK